MTPDIGKKDENKMFDTVMGPELMMLVLSCVDCNETAGKQVGITSPS